MVLHCRRRMWSRIVIQQQNARSEKPLFPNPCAGSHSTSTQWCIVVLHVHLMFPTEHLPHAKRSLFPGELLEAYQGG
ncbi:hypothetical protein TNCV_3990791 [Trichonephila clavipes]|uniref:Uncharacterized protein n=1 Tax=Trichonephila clavipes TaxID=2585209 RepID=A0A8X6VT52_TRICX|nr:hypothetical protein TNCV_3990791 [Trichonephila clavipes]